MSNKPMDAYHIRTKDIVEFLGISIRNFYSREGNAFPELRRDVSGTRYTDMVELVMIYERCWNDYPTRGHVIDFLTNAGLAPSQVQLWMNRLTDKGFVR